MAVIETPPRVSPAVRWLCGLALTTLPLLVVLVSYFWWADRLPDPMPSHWGRGGRLDGTTSLTGLVATFTVIAAVGAVVGAVGALASGAGARTRRWLVTGGAGTGAFGASTWLMLAAVALDVPDASQASMPSWQLAAVPVALLGWAWLAFATCPPPPHRPAPRRRPAADLPRIDLPAGQRAAYSEVARPGRWVYLLMVPTLLAAAGLAAWAATPWAAVPILVVVGVSLLLQITRITVDARGLRAGFGPWGWPRVTVPLTEIVSAEATIVRPREWGGWGYRVRRDGSRGLILRRGPGVLLGLSGERRFVASVREPEAVAGLVNTLIDRRR